MAAADAGLVPCFAKVAHAQHAQHASLYAAASLDCFYMAFLCNICPLHVNVQ